MLPEAFSLPQKLLFGEQTQENARIIDGIDARIDLFDNLLGRCSGSIGLRQR